MIKKKEVLPAEYESVPSYRYVCHGCGNSALFSSNAAVGVTITCNSCGKEQVTREENFIIL